MSLGREDEGKSPPPLSHPMKVLYDILNALFDSSLPSTERVFHPLRLQYIVFNLIPFLTHSHGGFFSSFHFLCVLLNFEGVKKIWVLELDYYHKYLLFLSFILKLAHQTAM